MWHFQMFSQNNEHSIHTYARLFLTGPFFQCCSWLVNLGIAVAVLFTGQMIFLLPNQYKVHERQHKMTFEGTNKQHLVVSQAVI